MAKKTAKSVRLKQENFQQIVDAAMTLLEQVYVHLPLKRAMHAIDPLQRLRLLSHQLAKMDERTFHNEMLSIFLRLRDLHTNYILPAPLNYHTAFLPFRIEQFFENGVSRYVVTSTFQTLTTSPDFVPGVIVTHWNGIPIDRAVDNNADREAGSNPAARHARGLAALTVRWLGMSLPPDEDWVNITFQPIDAPHEVRQARFDWQVFESNAAELGVEKASGLKAAAIGIDKKTEMERQVCWRLFRGSSRAANAGAQTVAIQSNFPNVFQRCEDVVTGNRTYAYIRIATFDVADDQAFIDEFNRLVGQLSPEGLIIDVRGNGGGLILAGERLLQCLTPKRIEAEKFHFINSRTTLKVTNNHGFEQWKDSIANATEIGADYSQGFALLPDDAYNDIGQTYQGPVVLIVDALCYSTTDIFAAGFQDHQIGKVLGVNANTGAGGANVWDYGLLQAFLGGATAEFPALPNGTDFRVAIRRTTRVGTRAGVPLEELGVRPDETHDMTLRDVMEGNIDLIEHAARLLAAEPQQRLQATVAKTGNHGFAVQWTADNIDRVDLYLNGRPEGSIDVNQDSKPQSAKLPQNRILPQGNVVQLRGYRNGIHVVTASVRF